jgi:hypothetical protein
LYLPKARGVTLARLLYIPLTKFKPFNRAAKVAVISGFFGGIHFIDAIGNCLIRGDKWGNMYWMLFTETSRLNDNKDMKQLCQ